MTITSVRLQEELEGPLEGLVQRLQRSKNWLINQALREYIERQQLEEVRWKETLTALESVQSGRTIPGESVHAWLESWGRASETKPPRR
jgi:predicted transcriptional regulator